MTTPTRHIFVTGGVASSLGKGLSAASFALLLEQRGLRVGMQKFDPYINVDPGTMSPFQHGEVYVTADGAETDLDLGHYERFTHARLDRHSNYTTGRIYSSVIAKERRGHYLGDTVQVIPHVTDEIRSAIKQGARDCDVCIHEVGGTVGDIESLPFLEAIRQFSYEMGRDRCLHIHLTLVPYLRAAGELKTKPTQHSVQQLRQIGIRPDVLICRTERPLAQDLRDKIALFCDVDRKAVIEARDVEGTVYEVPLVLRQQGLDDLICQRLGLPDGEPDLTQWEEMLDRLLNPRASTEIAVVGKYIELHDAYKSIYESLQHAGIANRARVHLRKVSAEDVAYRGARAALQGVRGLLIPGGFGERGIEGKIEACQFAREEKIPFFGICLGLQCAVIEAARNLCGLEGASSSEFDENTPDPVVSLMHDQLDVEDKGGTMRLGSYDCRLVEGTKVAAAYGNPTEPIRERHRHRFELNNAYRKTLEAVGFRVSGVNPERDLAEIMELRDHPWYVGVQFHPEFQSRPTEPHPLFREFVAATLERETDRVPAQETAS